MPWEPSTEKKFRIQLLLLSVIMGVLVVAGSLAYVGYQKKQTINRIRQTISAITDLKVEQLVRWNTERLSEVEFFSTSPSVLRFVLPVIAGEKSQKPQLKKTLEHILSDNRYEDIALYSTKGALLFSVANKAHTIDSVNSVLLDSMVRSKSILFRDFYFCPYESRTMTCYLAPILDKYSNVVGCLFFMVDPYDFFYPHIKNWPYPGTSAQSFLVKKYPDAIEYLSPVTGCDSLNIPCRTGKSMLDDIGIAVLTGNNDFIEGKDAQGVHLFAYVKAVPGTDWVLVSKANKDELFAEYRKIEGLVFLFCITLLLLLWGGILLVYAKRQRQMYAELHQKSLDLYHSQMEFGATLFNIGEGVIATDEKGLVTRLNSVASNMTGWIEAKAIGKPIETIFATYDIENHSLLENPVRMMLQQEGQAVENTNQISVLVSKEGKEAYISDSCALTIGPDNKVLGTLLIFRDQTEEQVRKRFLEARILLFEYAAHHNLEETLAFMSKKIGEIFNSPLCQLYSIIGEQKELILEAAWESEDETMKLAARETFSAFSGWKTCKETHEPILFNRHKDQGIDTGLTINHALIVPVMRETGPVALLGLANRKNGYTPLFVQHLSYLADVIWVIASEKQKESHLLESEDKYRTLVNQMQLGLALHEMIIENGVPVDYRFLEVNPGYERLTGLTREQLIGKTVLEVMPFTEPIWIEKFGHVVMKKEPLVVENYSRSLGKYYSVTAYPVGDLQFGAIVEDITERKQMIDALLSSEQSYKDLIDNIKDTVWIVDEKGNLFDVNGEVTKQLGYTKEEILQLGVKGIDATLSEKDILHINDLILSGEPQMFEAVHRAKNGKLIPVEVNAGRVNYMGKQVAVCLARDISQRKRAEGFQHLLYEIASFSTGLGSFDELLTLVRNELGKVMDATNFYVALYNPSTENLDELIFVNEKYSIHSWPVEGTLSGYVLKSGKSLLLNGDDRKEFLKINHINEVKNPALSWIGVPLSGDQSSLGVLVLQHYTDPNAYDTSNLQILETVAHELSVVIQRQRMINDLIQAKEKAEESDRLKTAFLANVSHEIRTPMNGILGFIEMLNDPETDPKDRAGYIDIVSKSGQRLLATIEDIIEISRIEAGLIELHDVETDLDETMDYQLSFFEAIAHEKGLTLELQQHLTGQDAFIEIDSFKLDGILSNLLNNALKFTRSGGIYFGNTLKDNELLFYVKDTGIGIPKDRQEAIFQRFVQADLTSTRPYEGSGLGLAIVKAYLDKMGGRIWVESEPGKGSTFYFTLPYKPISPNVVEKTDIPHAKEVQDAISILVADDDPISFTYLEILLKREGFLVYRASNGIEAVEMYKKHPYVDAILMDIKMPEMNGLDATRNIRKLNAQVPIIAQTAFAFVEDRENTLQAGCTDFLTKPTTSEQLLLSLQTHIKRLKQN